MYTLFVDLYVIPKWRKTLLIFSLSLSISLSESSLRQFFFITTMLIVLSSEQKIQFIAIIGLSSEHCWAKKKERESEKGKKEGELNN
jgi:hypothetical protein